MSWKTAIHLYLLFIIGSLKICLQPLSTELHETFVFQPNPYIWADGVAMLSLADMVVGSLGRKVEVSEMELPTKLVNSDK